MYFKIKYENNFKFFFLKRPNNNKDENKLIDLKEYLVNSKF